MKYVSFNSFLASAKSIFLFFEGETFVDPFVELFVVGDFLYILLLQTQTVNKPTNSERLLAVTAVTEEG
jgi:hypothetical protein